MTEQTVLLEDSIYYQYAVDHDSIMAELQAMGASPQLASICFYAVFHKLNAMLRVSMINEFKRVYAKRKDDVYA